MQKENRKERDTRKKLECEKRRRGEREAMFVTEAKIETKLPSVNGETLASNNKSFNIPALRTYAVLKIRFRLKTNGKLTSADNSKYQLE